jgi:uncharacterized membrane protein
VALPSRFIRQHSHKVRRGTVREPFTHRSPAIAGTTLVVTALGRRLRDANTGLVAGLLFAILPVSSRYAQEARPYAVVLFAAALATLALIRLLAPPIGWT